VSETEMKEQKATNKKSLSISRVMSAPSVDVQDDCKVRALKFFFIISLVPSHTAQDVGLRLRISRCCR
jgi:hypothetical protein